MVTGLRSVLLMWPFTVRSSWSVRRYIDNVGIRSIAYLRLRVSTFSNMSICLSSLTLDQSS